jgi:Protein of unknown function (DUF1573)
MSNGVKIGLLVVLAAALGILAFKMINKDGAVEARPATEGQVADANAQANSAQAHGGVGEASKERAKTTVKWETVEHDFGTIKQGDSVEYEFRFTNTGSEPLIIEDAKGSCGCTVPQKPSGPVAPGASDVIKVKFNSAGKSGAQKKTVTLTANTEPITTMLTIMAQVDAPAGGAKPAAGGGH